MRRPIESEKLDNLNSIMKKIKSGDDIEAQFKIFSLFWITQPHYRKALINSLKLWHPNLWKMVRRAYYPTLWAENKLLEVIK